MSLYKVSGLILRSELPLPELPRIGEGNCDLLFRTRSEPVEVPSSIEWFHSWHRTDGRPWLMFSKLGGGYLLRFPDLADFVISGDKTEIVGHPVPGVPPESIRHLLLDQVVPLVLDGMGELVLHASALRVGDHAIAFLGATGHGKSTLAGSFWSAGFPLLTDDCLILRVVEKRVVGIPSYPGLRLWPDSATELAEVGHAIADVAHYTVKKRLLGRDAPAGMKPSETIPIQAAYVLAELEPGDPAPTIRIEPLSWSAALMELTRNTFHLDVTDRERLRTEFEDMADVVGLLPFRRLSFRRDYSMLPAVREAVLADLRESA